MSTGESSRVLEALNVLCNAPGELLRPHLAAVQKLQSRIEGHSTAIVAATGRHTPCPTTDDRSATPSSVSHHSSSNHLSPNGSVPLSLSREDPSALLRDQHASPQPPLSSIEKFMRGLSNALERIKTFLSQERREFFTSEAEWMAEDPRIVDIQIAGVTSKPTANHKFRRGLSQRSLALEFDDWEINTHGISSTKERATNPSVQSIRKLGHITEFLEANPRRFHNLGAARDGIEHGIKLLVCEMLMGGIGVSAILIFRFSSLRALKYEELNDLKDAIEKQGSVKELAGQKADWLRQCQSEYDAWYNKVTRQSTLTAEIKRRCLSGSSSQHKRIKPGRPHVSNPNSKNPNTNKVLFTTGARAGKNNQTIPTRTSNTATTSPLQQTQSHQYEQNPQSSPSRIPSLQHLIHPNPPHPFGYKVSSGGCDGTTANSRSEMAIDDTSHRSFREPDPVSSSQSNPMQGAQGSVLSQYVQYSGQFGIPPISREGERYPQSTNVSAGRLYDLVSGAGHTADAGSCIPWFPDFDNTSGAEAPGLNSGAGPTADAGSCIPWFPDFNNMSGAEAPSLNFGAGPTADAGSCIPWFPDFDNTSGAEAPGFTAGAGNYVQGFENNI